MLAFVNDGLVELDFALSALEVAYVEKKGHPKVANVFMLQ